MRIPAIDKHHVHLSGAGRQTVVLGHGFGTDQRAWRFVAPVLAQRHRVVTFDLVGFGGSDRSTWADSRHATLEGYAEDLIELLDALDLQRVSFVGHSIGGVIGLLASVRQPQRFERLVLLGSSPRFVNDPPDYRGGFKRNEIEGILDAMERDQIAWSQSLSAAAIGEGNGPAMVEEFANGLRALDPLIARAFGRIAFMVDVRDRLPQVSVPALIVQCTRDSIVPREVGVYLHRQLARSTLREIDAAGHCPHLTHVPETLALLADYLGTPGD